MNFSQQYEELAKQLGDVYYKLKVLEKRKDQIIAEIKKLDDIAGFVNAQKNQAKPKGNTD